MQLQFQKKDVACLRQLTGQVLNQEQTLTLTLDDSMPKIGRVVGAWGQVLLRGKEWRNGSVVVTGGVMVWALYMPEEETECYSAEGWLPFQWKVDIPPTRYDGTVIANLLLRSVDARALTDKKLLLRANAGLQLQVLLPEQAQLSQLEQVPEDLQLLKKTYPIQIPVEAGEKAFAFDEILQYPNTCPQPEKLLFYRLLPQIAEQKMMADKVVFRGTAILHTVYFGQDGRLHTWDFELPFAQFGDLEGRFSEDATAGIRMAVTALDVQKSENGLQVNGAMTGQYVIYEKICAELITDAYSTTADIQLEKETVLLPMVSEISCQHLSCQSQLPASAARVVDTQFLPEHPCCARDEQGPFVELCGCFRMLWENEQGLPELTIGDWNHRVQCQQEGKPEAYLTVSGNSQGSNEGSVQAELILDIVDFAGQTLETICAVEIGEPNDSTDSPSLILRRVDGENLWEIAKATGSTVTAIKNANGLDDEPALNQMLIIPL